MKLSEMKPKETTIDGVTFKFRTVPGSVVMDYRKPGHVVKEGETIALAVSLTSGWNLENEDGSPMEITEDNFLKLGMDTIGKYIKRIMGAEEIPGQEQVKN